MRSLRPLRRARRFLVVDDDPDVRDTVVELLLDAGRQVIEAADGREALAQIAGSPPDAVVLDGMMPGLGGPEVLAQLRREARTRTLPVVALFTWQGSRRLVYTPHDLMSALVPSQPRRRE